MRGIRKDGGICWLEIHASRIEYDGRPAVQAAYVDITAHKQAEEAQRQSERKYRTLVEGAPSYILVVRGGRFIYANPACARHLGYEDPSTLVGLDVLTVVDPSCHSRVRERMCRAIGGGENPPMELKILAADGAARWVESVSLPITLDGEPAVLVIGQDITKRRRAEHELEKAHQFLLTVLKSFPGSVVVLDGAGVIAMTSDSWAVFGRANGPAPGSFGAGVDYLDVCRSATGPGSEGAWETAEAIAAVLSGERHDFQVDYPCHNPGQKRWFHLQVHGFSYGDKRWAVLAHTDITERRQVEDRLRGYQERLRSLAAKLALAREREKRRVGLGLHDEIGQRLVMIKLSLRALQETTDPETAEALARGCRDIDALTEQIRLLSFDLTNSVLHEVGFREAVEALLEQEVQQKHGIACKCQASGDFSGLDVEMKMALFCNVRELLASVIRYACPRQIHVCLKQDGGAITVVVEDDGEGLEWKQLTLPGASGGHLGLFSIREQMEALGGSMHIGAGPGRGTRITIVASIHCKAHLRS
jgi:PAS domain S-box-containing protein